MNTVHPKILQRILRVSLDKLTEGQEVRITKYILKLIRRSRGRRPKTRDVIEVLSWILPDFPPLRALLRHEEKNPRARRVYVTPIHPIRLLRRYPNRLAHPLTACRSNETKRCGIKSSPMSDTKAARFTLELITDCMNELARELGTMVN